MASGVSRDAFARLDDDPLQVAAPTLPDATNTRRDALEQSGAFVSPHPAAS